MDHRAIRDDLHTIKGRINSVLAELQRERNRHDTTLRTKLADELRIAASAFDRAVKAARAVMQDELVGQTHSSSLPAEDEDDDEQPEETPQAKKRIGFISD